jgi:hypothetical protein
MIRRLSLTLVLLAIWLAVLGWTANLPWNAPLTPRLRIAMPAANFQVQFGKGAIGSAGLTVTGLADDGTALQTVTLQRFPARDYPVLNYRITDFPDTLELALVFRRSDAPDDVQTISIGAPGRGETSIDLSSLPEWQGEITEVGFAEYATGQLVPPSLATHFKPFHLVEASLQSPAWSEVLRRLRSDWFGYRPWALYSISALGPQILSLQTSWMQPAMITGGVLSLLAAWLILGWSRRRIAQASLIAALAVWVLLDLRWLDDLGAKHRVIEQMFAGKSWSERVPLQPDEDAYAAAQDVVRIANQERIQRVLVVADTGYTLLRFIYFLLPLNAAPLDSVLASVPGTVPQGDVLIAAFISAANYDETTQILSAGASTIHAEPIYTKGDLRVFRSRGGMR